MFGCFEIAVLAGINKWCLSKLVWVINTRSGIDEKVDHMHEVVFGREHQRCFSMAFLLQVCSTSNQQSYNGFFIAFDCVAQRRMIVVEFIDIVGLSKCFYSTDIAFLYEVGNWLCRRVSKAQDNTGSYRNANRRLLPGYLYLLFRLLLFFRSLMYKFVIVAVVD